MNQYIKHKKRHGGSSNSQLEPVTAKFIESLKSTKPVYMMTTDEARKALEGATISPIEIQADVQDLVILNNIPIRITRPLNTQNIKLPVVMYFHGGGWVMGNKNTHDRIVRKIAVESNVVVIFVDYTLAPEAKFPTQINQCYDTMVYIVKNADKFNVDVSRLITCGDSVGGNITIAVSLLAKRNNGPKIIMQILLYPVTDSSMMTCSYKEFENGPWLTKKSMEWFFGLYLSNVNDRNNILISPLKATNEELSGLPKTLLIVDENDVLRDEGEMFGRKLMNAGVDVNFIRYLGTIHDFLILGPIKDTPAVKGALNMIMNEINKMLKLNP